MTNDLEQRKNALRTIARLLPVLGREGPSYDAFLQISAAVLVPSGINEDEGWDITSGIIDEVLGWH